MSPASRLIFSKFHLMQHVNFSTRLSEHFQSLIDPICMSHPGRIMPHFYLLELRDHSLIIFVYKADGKSPAPLLHPCIHFKRIPILLNSIFYYSVFLQDCCLIDWPSVINCSVQNFILKAFLTFDLHLLRGPPKENKNKQTNSRTLI